MIAASSATVTGSEKTAAHPGLVITLARTAEYTVTKVIDRMMGDLSNSWSMPGKVLEVIRSEVSKVVDAQVKTALITARKAAEVTLGEDLNRAIEAAEQKLRDITFQQRAEFAAHMEERIREVARTSFLDVLREAREGVL